VAKTMNELSSQESQEFEQNQQQEYLKTQEEILEVCEMGDEDCQEKDIDWKKMTEKNSTLKIRTYKDGRVVFSGQSWSHFPVNVKLKDEEDFVREWNLETDIN
jgi:NADH:ubiquinone oxidoreductase subunit